jgi:hypothetical protein
MLVAGCTDPEARYDDFLERTSDMRGGEPDDGGEPMPGERFDWSGDYVLGLAATLSPAQPLVLSAEVDVAYDLATFDMVLQPLTTEADDEPRTPVGETFTLEDVTYAVDGSFETPPLEVTIPGRANPISGSEIVAEVVLIGSPREADGDLPQLFCGQAEGAVSEPLQLDLTGSTFGAIPEADLDELGILGACPD